MDIYRASEKLMSMSNEVWARHANPWSAWSRFSCLPLIVLAIWSRDWIGGWAWLVLALALFWTWLNPRLFATATDWDTWSAKGTSGERVFLHHRTQIAPHHRRVAYLLTAAAAVGLPPLAYGLWVLSPGWVIAGLVLTILPKLWFVDRMVWIWEDFQRDGGSLEDLKQSVP